MIGTTEAAFLLGICCHRVRQLLQAGRIIGAVKVGRFWRIPLFN
jgi:excisionase family DNA binding protein